MLFPFPEAPKGDPSPFNAEGGNRGALCLHGLSGTPYDVRPLAELLASDGWSVRAPLLPGHGGTVRELAESRWLEWLHSAEAELLSLSDRIGRPAAIAGLSMGGLLALELALRHPDRVAAAALLAVPLRLKPWQEKGIRFIRRRFPDALLRSAWASWPKFGGSDCADEAGRKANPSLPAIPIRALASLLDLRDGILPRLDGLRPPALVIHSAGDRTVPFDASLELLERLDVRKASFQWLSRSRHTLLRDVDRELVIDTITRFFDDHAAPHPAR